MSGLIEILVSAVVFALFFATNKVKKINVDLVGREDKHGK